MSLAAQLVSGRRAPRGDAHAGWVYRKAATNSAEARASLFWVQFVLPLPCLHLRIRASYGRQLSEGQLCTGSRCNKVDKAREALSFYSAVYMLAGEGVFMDKSRVEQRAATPGLGINPSGIRVSGNRSRPVRFANEGTASSPRSQTPQSAT